MDNMDLLITIGDLEVERRRLLNENFQLKKELEEERKKNMPKPDTRKYDDIAKIKLAENT